MGTTSDKLLYLQDTKSAIKDAIVAKGVTVPTGTTFRDYATKIGDITTGSGGGAVADTWVRPSEWLAIPANVSGVQKVSILNAVFDTDSEYVAFVCAGSYTVDWGDGTSNNYDSGTKAEHKYDYNNTNLNSDTVSKFGYKQCIITITPQAGQNLTLAILNYFHSAIGSGSIAYNLSSGFLDININAQYISSTVNFGLCTYNLGGNSAYVKHTLLERVSIGEIGLTSLSYLFYNCYSLQKVEFGFNTAQVTSWSSAFQNCYSLQVAPSISFNPSGVTVSSMYYGCKSLVEVPDMNVVLTGSPTNAFFECFKLQKIVLNITIGLNRIFDSLFYNCYKLSDLTLTISGNGKINNLSGTFYNCYSLSEAPALDTSACTNFSYTFTNSGITKTQNYSFAVATTLASVYEGCKNLKYVPNITLSSACTTLQGAFNICTSLEKAPNITGGTNVTTVASMYSGCTSLTYAPSYNFPAVTTTGLGNLYANCTNLQIANNIAFNTGVTANTNILSGIYSLKRMLIPLKFTFSVANAKMSATALNEMYTLLPTVTGQTVTVTGNYGTASDDPTIATAKGWTVVG